MVKACQDVDIGLPPNLIALPICRGIPGPSARCPPNDNRWPRLIPTLHVCGRLDLKLEAGWGDQIERIPFASDAAEVDAESTRDDEFGEPTARDVTDEIGTAPLPEGEQVDREGLTVRVELLGTVRRAAVTGGSGSDISSLPPSNLNWTDRTACRNTPSVRMISADSPEVQGKGKRSGRKLDQQWHRGRTNLAGTGHRYSDSLLIVRAEHANPCRIRDGDRSRRSLRP